MNIYSNKHMYLGKPIFLMERERLRKKRGIFLFQDMKLLGIFQLLSRN